MKGRLDGLHRILGSDLTIHFATKLAKAFLCAVEAFDVTISRRVAGGHEDVEATPSGGRALIDLAQQRLVAESLVADYEITPGWNPASTAKHGREPSRLGAFQCEFAPARPKDIRAGADADKSAVLDDGKVVHLFVEHDFEGGEH